MFALTLTPEQKKILELAFAAVFSALILIIFYSVMSMNGLVLGNDPAVHLEKAQIFLQTGKIPLNDLSWTPPLYQILLATVIAFTGASNLEQMILLVKTTAVVIDWLLFFSVYLIGAKFFSKKTGAIAAVYTSANSAGKRAAQIISEFIDNNWQFKNKLYYPTNFSVRTNYQVAKSLGISLPDDDTLHNKIMLMEHE